MNQGAVIGLLVKVVACIGSIHFFHPFLSIGPSVCVASL